MEKPKKIWIFKTKLDHLIALYAVGWEIYIKALDAFRESFPDEEILDSNQVENTYDLEYGEIRNIPESQ